MLKVENIEVRYGRVPIIRNLSFTVEEGDFAALVGANGAGKTTTLRAVSGLLRPVRGRIWFQGERIDGLPPHEIVARGLVQVAEGRRLFPKMSVLENLELGASGVGRRGSLDKDLERMYELFPILRDRRHQAAGSLSGGEQQMLAIGRALMTHPRLLMLDEPSQGLAPLMVKHIFDIAKALNESGVTLLLVEQNVQHALQAANRAYVLENGQIVLQGGGRELLGDEHLKRAYLGI